MGYSRSSVAWELRELVAAAAPHNTLIIEVRGSRGARRRDASSEAYAIAGVADAARNRHIVSEIDQAMPRPAAPTPSCAHARTESRPAAAQRR